MLQIQGVEGQAVICNREPSTTQEMTYPRFSRRVNNMASSGSFRMSPKANSNNRGYNEHGEVLEVAGKEHDQPEKMYEIKDLDK